MTLVICTVVLAVGITSDYAFGRLAEDSIAASIAYRVIPNVGPFWVIDGLSAGTQETIVTLPYVSYVMIYAMLLVTGILSLAVALFQKREVG